MRPCLDIDLRHHTVALDPGDEADEAIAGAGEPISRVMCRLPEQDCPLGKRFSGDAEWARVGDRE